MPHVHLDLIFSATKKGGEKKKEIGCEEHFHSFYILHVDHRMNAKSNSHKLVVPPEAIYGLF